MEKTMQYFQMPGPTVTFQNLRYCVQDNRVPCRKKGPEKEILKNVRWDIVRVYQADMVKVYGRRLLDVIAGRKNPAGLRSGEVMVDSKVVTSDLRLSSAYVVQDDILMGCLSVRENLAFSANLRLSRQQYSSSDKEQKVNDVIKDLGGEKKRCSIGMELITSPSLLFLDEPTTGLDANTANSVISLLHRLSRTGKTVIFSIHQPRYSIFRQFDHLTLMSIGEIIYAGAASQAMSYFEELGYQRDPFNNPADFFLDITNGDVVCTLESSNIEERNPLALKYRESALCRQAAEELKQATDVVDSSVTVVREKACYATPFHYQLMVLVGRTVKNTLRNPQTSYAQMALNIFFALLVGLIYYQIPKTLPEALQNRIGAFFFLILNMVFGNLSAVELFVNERALFVHENSSGYYRTSAYFLAKVFADLLPNRILPIFVFSASPTT
ncbi:hypothetical protein AAFF_G00271330 [Aldrovandia affinis]|uniref:ABC transporter domain-containing protein n=1 Tax=Aldrovandia affinis TaxID=143900 RepID=A0AAD7RAT0_9TELE|nr:hypothetical protein AAFF_G00271330 [Aldrovandia affinis]